MPSFQITTDGRFLVTKDGRFLQGEDCTCCEDNVCWGTYIPCCPIRCTFQTVNTIVPGGSNAQIIDREVIVRYTPLTVGIPDTPIESVNVAQAIVLEAGNTAGYDSGWDIWDVIDVDKSKFMRDVAGITPGGYVPIEVDVTWRYTEGTDATSLFIQGPALLVECQGQIVTLPFLEFVDIDGGVWDLATPNQATMLSTFSVCGEVRLRYRFSPSTVTTEDFETDPCGSDQKKTVTKCYQRIAVLGSAVNTLAGDDIGNCLTDDFCACGCYSPQEDRKCNCNSEPANWNQQRAGQLLTFSDSGSQLDMSGPGNGTIYFEFLPHEDGARERTFYEAYETCPFNAVYSVYQSTAFSAFVFFVLYNTTFASQDFHTIFVPSLSAAWQNDDYNEIEATLTPGGVATLRVNGASASDLLPNFASYLAPGESVWGGNGRNIYLDENHTLGCYRNLLVSPTP